jgi:hypothetical protein
LLCGWRKRKSEAMEPRISTRWHKSSYSGTDNNCVEVARTSSSTGGHLDGPGLPEHLAGHREDRSAATGLNADLVLPSGHVRRRRHGRQGDDRHGFNAGGDGRCGIGSAGRQPEDDDDCERDDGRQPSVGKLLGHGMLLAWLSATITAGQAMSTTTEE